MRHLFLAAVIGLLAVLTNALAQPEILWSLTYPSSAEAEVCNDLVAMGDDLYYITGNSRRTAHHTRMLTMIVNGEGAIARRDTFGLSDHRLCNAVLRRSDGTLVLAGSFTRNQTNPHRNGYVMIADAGDSLASAEYGSTGVDQFNSVVQDTGGVLVLAGQTSSSGAGESDFWLVSSNPPLPGPINRTYGGAEADECREVLLTPDMGYLLAGMTRSFGPGTRNMFILKTDSAGDSLWSRVIGGSGSQECNAAVLTPDGGFALAGHDNFEFYLVRTDSEGILLWSRTYEGYKCEDIVLTQDGGFLLIGDIYSGGSAEWDGRVVRTDSQGNELWSLTLDQEIDDHFYAAGQSPDGGFVLGGYTNALNGPDQIWLVRLGTESPIITVGLNGAHDPVVRWIAPVSGTYFIFSTVNPNFELSIPLGSDWTWEATLPGIPPGSASWTDQEAGQRHKFYVVVRSTL